MNKPVVMPAYATLEELENLLKELADYEGQVIVLDSHPDHEKKHMVRHLVKHNVYLPLTAESDVSETVNKFLQNVSRKWVLILDSDTEAPPIGSLEKMSLYDTGLFEISE